MARLWQQHQYHLIPVPFCATTAAWRSITGEAAPCLPRSTEKATNLSSKRRNLVQGAVLNRSGILCIRRPRTTTTSARPRGLQVNRRVVRTRLLRWETEPATVIPKLRQLFLLTTISKNSITDGPMIIQQEPPTIIRGALSTRGHRKDVARDRCK